MKMGKKKQKVTKMGSARRRDMIFYGCIFAIPFINFCVLQFYVNYVDVILFMFKRYDFNTAQYVFSPEWTENFKTFFFNISREVRWGSAFKISFKNYILGWLISTPVSLLVPWYIYKKYLGTGIFKFVLMLPTVISSIVWMSIITQLTEVGYLELFHKEIGLLSNPETQWITLFVAGIWTGMASSMLIYTGTYSGISDGLVDAAAIDGVGALAEFWYLGMPRIWPIFSISVITGIAGIFSSAGGNVYEYFGYSAGDNVVTVGYLLFVTSLHGTGNDVTVSCVSSVMFTVVILPLTLFIKSIVEQLGPTEEERPPFHWFWQKKRGIK